MEDNLQGKIELLTYRNLSAFSNIFHFTTTRKGGVSHENYEALNLSPFSGDCLSDVLTNQRILTDYLQISHEHLIIPYQIHKDRIKIIPDNFKSYSAQEKNEFLYGVDALITNISGFCIGITTADCTPILLYDSEKKVVASIHAGWRGTVKSISEKTVLLMQSQFACCPENIWAAIGPCIGETVYEVGDEVFLAFKENGFPMNEISFFNEQTKKYHINLTKANTFSLIKAGVPVNHIESADVCTFNNAETFFSARKQGIQSGRFLSAIMLKEES